jgi:branched-chain amino acid transport system permease protein
MLLLHLAVVGLLAGLQLVLPPFHHGMLARVMVLAAYAVGYNVLLGYTGLMSLGHAMFFAAGMYGTALTIHHLGFGVAAGFLAGAVAGLAIAAVVARRTRSR